MKAALLLLEAAAFAHWLFPPHVGTWGLSEVPALLIGAAFVVVCASCLNSEFDK